MGVAYGTAALDTTMARGFVALGLELQGKRADALRLFSDVFTTLKGSQRASEGVADRGTLTVEYRRVILDTYVGALVHAGVDSDQNNVKAFSVADALRNTITERALITSATRAKFAQSELADLVRREQDAQQQLGARLEILSSALALPIDQQDAATLATLRSEIESLKSARGY
jgi:hypothetical protein